MSLSLERERLSVCASLFDGTGKQAMDSEYVLPDYCGEIKRILKCTAEPQLHHVGKSGERLIAEGDVRICMLYVTEQDTLDCFEQHCSLSVACRAGDIPSDTVIQTHALTEYVNCRAVNPRKILINGTVGVQFRVLQAKDTTFIANMKGCEIKTAPVAYSALHVLAEKTFDLSETISLDSAKQPIRAMLRASALPEIQSVQCVENKLLLKGTLHLEAVYLTEDKTLCSFSHSMPISQIAEAPGLNDESAPAVRVQMCAFYVQPKRDANEEARLLELAAKLQLLIRDYSEETVSTVSDCYATNGNLLPVFSKITIPQRMTVVQIKKQAELSVEIGAGKGSRLLDLSILKVHTDVSFEASALLLHHTLLVAVLYQDEAGAFQYLEREASFDTQESLQCEGEQKELEPFVQIRLDQYRLTEDGEIRAQAEVFVEGTVSVSQEQTMLTDATLEDEPSADQSSLVLAFSKKGTALWDLAKHYQTAVDAIRYENALQEDVLSEDRMLLIPSSN